jgi:hypothetical protein
MGFHGATGWRDHGDTRAFNQEPSQCYHWFYRYWWMNCLPLKIKTSFPVY